MTLSRPTGETDGRSKDRRTDSRGEGKPEIPHRLRARGTALQMPGPRVAVEGMGRAEDTRAARSRLVRAFPARGLPLPLQFTLCQTPRELRPEVQSRRPEDRSLRAAIFGPGRGRRWRSGARGSVCERRLPGPQRRHRLGREGKASRGAGWRLDRPSVTSSGPRSGAAPCRLLACQGARQGGAPRLRVGARHWQRESPEKIPRPDVLGLSAGASAATAAPP